MCADFSRPSSGFRYKNGGMKTSAPPDAVGDSKYPLLVNVRSVDDTTLQTRPGMDPLFSNPQPFPFTDVRAYSTLGTDNDPRFLARDAHDNIVLDTSTVVGALNGAGASPGAALIPFRPDQSPEPYMYIANGQDYQKFSAPDALDNVTQRAVGIIEPQAAPEAGVSSEYQSFQGEPVGGSYTHSAGVTGFSVANRITDQVVDVFPDPNGTGTSTLQVIGGLGGIATAIYLYGSVRAYFFPADHSWNGAFGYPFPLDTSTAAHATQGNSLNFNPIEFNGTLDPNVVPIEWAILDNTGAISGYQMPWVGATEHYDMVLIFQLYVPVAGNYTLKVNHDDGVIFAVAGTSLVSGAHSDAFAHVRTAVQGLTFTNTTVAGSNISGFTQENFVINFPAPGIYSAEVDYGRWNHSGQSLNLRRGDDSLIVSGGTQSYQRWMAILLDAQATIVQDVYPPLPQGLGISALFYYSGNTGRCVIVPATLSPGSGNAGTSLYDQAILAGLRRGALIQLGGEVCYVESVTTGPNGTVSFETTTTGAHIVSELLNGVPAISILGPATAGQAITSPDIEFTSASGITTITNPVSANPFVNGNSSFQEEDYIHFSINVDDLANLTELKLLFDVDDGSFTHNYYFYSVRPSDIAAGVDNTLTQLGVAQLVTQRAQIDEEHAAASGNQATTFSSAQTVPGSTQWSEIMFPISELTRVGNAQNKTLQNVNAVQYLFNASATILVKQNSLTVMGGFAPDVGDTGIPYQYRIRPRSSVTGIKGNPSPAMRYGLSPRRQQVTVITPTTYADPQMNVWDVFRFGGVLTSWRFIGFTPLASGMFIDNFGDDAAEAGAALDFDNLEPWPTIDLPLNATTVSVTGTTALVSIPSPTNVLRMLPGNLVQLGGQNVFHLWNRPTLISGALYLFQFVENAGALTGVSLVVNEPLIAKQALPYMWGPDADGTVFAVGDPFRPGTISFCKNNNPDAAPDRYNVEITPPTEPLIGGETKDGVSYVASTERWWRLYAQGTAFLNPEVRTQHYSAVQQGIPRGLAAPYGHCTDGATIYFWAKDGIWSDTSGSLTDADLYNLFPHDGVAGVTVTYNGVQVQPPDYSRAGNFRLTYSNGYLYAIYVSSAGLFRQLTLDIKRGAWCVDEAPVSRVSCAYHVEQQTGGLLTGGHNYPRLLLGAGQVMAVQRQGANDLGAPIAGAVATMEWDAGDARSNQNWGDLFLDCVPAAVAAPLRATPMSGGVPAFTPTIVSSGAGRQEILVSLGGGELTRFMGLLTTWTDDYTHQGVPTQLFVWQPSYINKPETIGDRDTDWMNVQPEGAAGWVQGFVYHADTGNQVKGLQVRDSDTLQLHSYTPVFQHNGESIKAYSFDVPFIAHQVRFEPTDQTEWRSFDSVIVAEPTPEMAETWQAQGTSFEFNGYSHIQRVVAAYAASAPVTLTVTTFDGQSPNPIILPSTGGAYQKLLVVFTFNKGLLYFIKGQSALPWQAYWEDWEWIVGNWGRTGPYITFKGIGGKRGDQAKV